MYKRRGQQEYKWYVLGAIERLKITIVMKKPFPIKCVLEKSCIDSGDQKFLRH